MCWVLWSLQLGVRGLFALQLTWAVQVRVRRGGHAYPEEEGRGERRAVGPVGGGVRGMLTGNMRGLDGQFVLMLCCATTRRRGKLARSRGGEIS